MEEKERQLRQKRKFNWPTLLSCMVNKLFQTLLYWRSLSQLSPDSDREPQNPTSEGKKNPEKAEAEVPLLRKL